MQMELAHNAPAIRGAELELQFLVRRFDETAAHGAQFAGTAAAPGPQRRDAREHFQVPPARESLKRKRYKLDYFCAATEYST